MQTKHKLALFVIGGLIGCLFASVSTYDFIQHLDRGVHGVHCSFVPGLTGTEVDHPIGAGVDRINGNDESNDQHWPHAHGGSFRESRDLA